ncbi:MAG: GNAT family N-acetyltransferase [Chloroflexota bacterium]|nr:GNAT family N-acetyltransferase [Chloroflexota bacterium]
MPKEYAEPRKEGEALEIRDARPAEYERIGKILVAAYSAVDPELGGYADDLRDVAARAAAAEVLVAAERADPVGTVTYVPGPGPYAEWEDPDAAGIRMLAVDPEWQGRGLGAALVRACIERAQAAGRARIRLHTTDLMAAAQHMYERLGFLRTSENDWEPAPGFWLRAYRLDLG